MKKYAIALAVALSSFNLSAASFEPALQLNSLNNNAHHEFRAAKPIEKEHHVIRMGIFYTGDLAQSYPQEALTQYIDRQINAANVVMENSGLSIRREVGYVGLYPIANSNAGIREFLATIYDNGANSVHEIAQQFGLDYITILRPHVGNSYCGWAYYTDPYAVMELGGNCTSATLGAHEWGHNDGADHDIANSSDTPTRVYGRGYNCAGEGTIMSTSNNWFNRHNFYSSPSKQVNGEACGESDVADVTRMLNELKELPNHLGNRQANVDSIANVSFTNDLSIEVNEGDFATINLALVDNENNVITLDRDVSIELVSRGGSAHAGLDYLDVAQRVVFKAGESIKSINVSTLLDANAELAEKFTLALRHGDAVSATPDVVEVEIAANDDAKLTYHFETSDIVLADKASFQLAITRAGASLVAEDLLIESDIAGLIIDEVLITFTEGVSTYAITIMASATEAPQIGNIFLKSLVSDETVASTKVTIQAKTTKKSTGGAGSFVLLLLLLAGLRYQLRK